MKKFLALALVLTMALGLSVSAMAAEGTGVQRDSTGDIKTAGNGVLTVTITSVLQLPKIVVTVGDIGDITVNPYKMTVGSSSDSVISEAVLVTSKSDVALNVDLLPNTKKETEGSSLSILAAKPETDPGDKAIFLFLETKDKNTDNTTLGAQDTAPTLTSITNWKTVSNFESGTNCVIASENNSTKARMELPVPSATDGTKGSYGAFKITGASYLDPSDAWTTSDKVIITVIFDINPVVGA